MISPATSVLDEAVLDGYRFLQEQGQPDVITEFIDVFLADLPKRLAQIGTAVAARDPMAVWVAAHALKGSAGSIGAVRVSSLAAELETMGRSAGLARAVELEAAIRQEASATVEALRRHRK